MARWNCVNRIGHVVQTAEFAALENFVKVEQNDQTSFQLPDTCDVVQLAFLEYILWSFNLRRGDTQDFGCRIHHQSNQTILQLDHHDAVFLTRLAYFFVEAFAQIDNRNNPAAKIDYAFNIVGRVWDRCNSRYAHYFAHQ